MAVAVSGVVDAFVLAAEVEAPVALEVAGGDEGAELEDGLGAFEAPAVRFADGPEVCRYRHVAALTADLLAAAGPAGRISEPRDVLHRHRPGTLTRLDGYLHQRTRGMIGSLLWLIRGAAITAVIDGTEQVTRKSLDAAETDMASQNASPARPAR